MKTLGFGILGAGLIAPFHAKAVQNAVGGKLVAVCDLNRERANAVANEYGIEAIYDFGAMLDNPEVDVINVALPNHLHYDPVIQAAQAGKHVITEKPPAMSLKEVDAMIQACRAADVKFACMVQCRVRKAICAIKNAVENGRFGRLLHADAYMKWFRPTDYYKSDAWRALRRAGAGVTVQQAFHYIDLLQFVAGSAAKVQARMTNIAHPDIPVEDTLLAFVDFQNGAQGVVQASTALWPGTDIRIEINGTDGTAIMLGERIDTWKFRDERPEDHEIRKYGSAAQSTGATGAADFGFEDHQVVIQDMIDAVKEDREVLIPVSSVRPTLEIVLGMYQSQAYGRAVEFPVTDDESIWD